MFRKFFAFAALFCAGLSPLSGLGHAETIKTDIQIGQAPIVVELFTSQGCVSCPAADKILGQLSNHPRIFALSCHVTYWDRADWKDTLGKQFCTDRQVGYMTSKKTQNYYTPQMVINGGAEFPGNRADEIKKSIEAQSEAMMKPISLSRADSHTLIAGLPFVPTNDPMTLWIFGYKSRTTQSIGGGAHKGKDLTYHNTIISLDSIGNWQGRAELRRIDIGRNDGIDGIVIIAQASGHGPILAAGRLEF